jgi:hypothetical protein
MNEELAEESLSRIPLVFEKNEELALCYCYLIRGLKPACIMSFIDRLCMPPKPIGLRHFDSSVIFSTRTVCLPVSIYDKLALASLFFLC